MYSTGKCPPHIRTVSLLVFSLSILVHFALAAQVRVADLTCEYQTSPMGIGHPAPRLSWILDADAQMRDVHQAAYQIQVASSLRHLERGRADIWDPGRRDSGQSVHIVYEGATLQSRGRYYWRVKIWDQDESESAWSEIAHWEMGLLDTSEWSASWISPARVEGQQLLNGAHLLRKEFATGSKIARARLYITSHGLYEATINGTGITDHLFTPGWTSYYKRLQYQVYDITPLLLSGNNTLVVELAQGWYRGFGNGLGAKRYGDELALLAQLEINYENGQSERIITDGSWQSGPNPIRSSDMYDGELYDARLADPAVYGPGYQHDDWLPVVETSHSLQRLVASNGVPVKVTEILEPKEILQTPQGDTVVDFGQNMVGWVQITANGEAGHRIVLTHAEVLDWDGNFYTENLRSADQRVEYICDGQGTRSFSPKFSFQGFRYVKISGYPGPLERKHFRAMVIHSDMKARGTFETGDSLLNRLQSNIQWGQRGNFLDVPTDCPQRDERLGWTGDAQAFVATACFNYHTASFFTKWLADLRADQKSNGAVPFVVPHVMSTSSFGASGWGDAATIVPWTIYQHHGDRRLLEESFPSMKRWVEYLGATAGDNYLIQGRFQFGDWLYISDPQFWHDKPGYTDKDLIATAFFAHSAKLCMQAAKVLDQEEEVDRYRQLYDKIKAAFQHEFVTPSGRLSSHSQTAYVLALSFGLLPDDLVKRGVAYLTQNIKKRAYHLSTGFLGTPQLCHVLSANGQKEIAYRLLLQETYPSWLYPVTKGATTIWERWDGIKSNGQFQSPGMNSFNHYAYGAIGDWMYSTVSGIQIDPEQPGYKHTILRPDPYPALGHATASLHTDYGKLRSHWRFANDSLYYSFEVPPNTTATIILPQEGIDQTANSSVEEVGSGQHHYTFPYVMAFHELPDTYSVLGHLLTHPLSRPLVQEYLPAVASLSQESLSPYWQLDLEALMAHSPDLFPKDQVIKLAHAVQKLK